MLKFFGAMIAADVSLAVKRQVTFAAWSLLGAIFALMGCVYAIGALHAWLLLSYSAIEASLFIAAGLLLVAMLVMLVAVTLRRRKPSANVASQSAAMVAPLAAGLLMDKALKAKPTASLLGIAAVVVFGIIAGRSMINRDKSG